MRYSSFSVLTFFGKVVAPSQCGHRRLFKHAASCKPKKTKQSEEASNQNIYHRQEGISSRGTGNKQTVGDGEVIEWQNAASEAYRQLNVEVKTAKGSGGKTEMATKRWNKTKIIIIVERSRGREYSAQL